MSVAGGRRVVVLYFFVVAFLIFPALQIWVCRDCKAAAARVFPGFHGDNNDTTSSSVKRKKSRDVEQMFEKFFNGRRDLNLSDTTGTGKGFDDNKRRVPSCPDPLHN